MGQGRARQSVLGVDRTNVLTGRRAGYERSCCFPVCIGTRGGCCHKLYKSVGSGTGPACILESSSSDRAVLQEVGAMY